ncbi:hypothetical protein OSTOST_12398, partial [Ostertagia ostertagi]
MLVPECYCVDECYMERERAVPNSTDLYPVNPREFGHHLWSNAVYIILLLVREGLIHKSDLDPINRHLPASQRPMQFKRHSEFQGSMEGDPVVQIALLAESTHLQMTLSTYGISCQTPHEVEPIQIWPSWRMVKRDIEFVARRWKLTGRPTMCLLLREENIVGEYFDHILDLLVQLKTGYVNGIRVRVGRVHQLLNTSCIEHIDFASSDDVEFDIDVLEETGRDQILSRNNLLDVVDDETTDEKEVQKLSDEELCEIIRKDDVDRPRLMAFTLTAMWMRRHPETPIHGCSIRERMERLYRRVCQLRLWWLVRYCAGRLRKAVNSLAPGITNMLVRGKQVTLGVRSVREVVISRPISPGELVDTLFSCCPQEEPHIAVMQQELIIACSDLMSKTPSAFDGVLTIRLSWLADAITLLLNYVRVTGSRIDNASSLTPATPGTTGIPA